MKNIFDKSQKLLKLVDNKSNHTKYYPLHILRRVNLFISPISLGSLPVKAFPPTIFISKMKNIWDENLKLSKLVDK